MRIHQIFSNLLFQLRVKFTPVKGRVEIKAVIIYARKGSISKVQNCRKG